MQKKSFDTPDQTMTPAKTKIDICNLDSGSIARSKFEPGWKWSVDLKPSAGTDTCQMHHVLCVMSGRLKVIMDDGSEMDFGPGDIADIPAGHDAWVVGDEAVVGFDVAGIVDTKG